MTALEIWRNQQISRLRKDMDRLFDRVWGEFGPFLSPRAVRMVPFINMAETERNLIIKVKIPDMDPEDLDIAVTENILTIKGKSKREFTKDGETYHRTERRYDSFSRVLQLPCKIVIDDVEATYNDGILEIVMPKCKPEKGKKIKIEWK